MKVSDVDAVFVLILATAQIIEMAQAHPQANRPVPIQPFNPDRQHSEPER